MNTIRNILIMEKVIYANKGGCGLILNDNECETDFIIPQSVKLHDVELKPGEFTTLDGQFSRPIRYAGILKDSEFTEMCFHTGNDENLFEMKKYYYIFYWIHENRIANCYSYGSARDFIWKNNQWK